MIIADDLDYLRRNVDEDAGIEIEVARTINLGNYENEKIVIRMTVHSDFDIALQNLRSYVANLE